MPQICDMGQTALLPFWRKACWGFFRLKKSDGFGRERAHDLGYQRPACYPLGYRSCLSRAVTGLLTVYNAPRRHLHLLGLIDSPLSRCGAEDEISAHILCECEVLASLRHVYLGSFCLEPEDIKSIWLGVIWNFGKVAGLPWIKMGHKEPIIQGLGASGLQGPEPNRKSVAHTTVESFQLTRSVVNKRKILKYYIFTGEKWDVIGTHMATGSWEALCQLHFQCEVLKDWIYLAVLLIQWHPQVMRLVQKLFSCGIRSDKPVLQLISRDGSRWIYWSELAFFSWCGVV
jgi:hypothetical protein